MIRLASIQSLVCIALLFFLNACGGSGSSGSTDGNTQLACGSIGLPTKIINGQTCGGTANAPVARVMALVQAYGELHPVPICSGSHITNEIVLTAAHCFIPEIEGYPVVGYGIYQGDPGVGQYVNGVGFAVPDSYHYNPSVGRVFDDAALILLERSVPNPVLPLLTSRAPLPGEPGFVYGYGARGVAGQQADFASLEAGAMTVAEVTQNHLFAVFDGSGVNVCNGDSGGPLVVMVNGQPALAGLTSQGSVVGCVAGDVTTFTNIHSPGVFDWLINIVPNALARSNFETQADDFMSFSEIVEEMALRGDTAEMWK